MDGKTVGKILALSLLLVFNQQYILVGYGDEECSVVTIEPSWCSVAPLEEFIIGVYCNPSESIKSFECCIHFNQTSLSAVRILQGDIFSEYPSFFNNGTIDNDSGEINLIYDLILGEGMTQEPGYLFWIEFIANNCSGISDLTLFNVGITNESVYLPVHVINGSVYIEQNTPVISNISFELTAPIEPNLPFGLYNFSCDITHYMDHEVFMSLSCPNGSSMDIPMTMLGDERYYCTVTFLNYGLYEYFISVVVDINNSISSGIHFFSLSPMYDVSGDGNINYIDALLVWAHRENNPLAYPYEERYDMNGDGRVTYIDVLMVWNNKDE